MSNGKVYADRNTSESVKKKSKNKDSEEVSKKGFGKLLNDISEVNPYFKSLINEVLETSFTPDCFEINNLGTNENAFTGEQSGQVLNIESPSEKQAQRIAYAVSQNAAVTERSFTNAGEKGTADEETEKKARSLFGQGKALDPALLIEMEMQFGAQLGNVAIHSHAEANKLCEALNCESFALDENIFLRTENFQLHTPKGKELLAHELTHILQQRESEKFIQCALKFEFQTRNYLWLADKNGNKPNAVKRKYTPSGTYNNAEDGGNQITYLAVGPHGESAVNIRDKIIPPKGKKVLQKVQQFSKDQPAEYVVRVHLKNKEKYNELLKSGSKIDFIKDDMDSFLKDGISINRPCIQVIDVIKTSENGNKTPVVGTVEIQYFDTASLPSYTSYTNNDTPPPYLNIHFNKSGKSVENHVKHMKWTRGLVWNEVKSYQNKVAETTRNFKIKSVKTRSGNVAFSSTDQLIGKDATDVTLEELQKEERVMPEGKKVLKNTYEINYFDSSGNQLMIHVDEKGIFQTGHVSLMTLKKTKNNTVDWKSQARFLTEITVIGVQKEEDIIGKSYPNKIYKAGKLVNNPSLIIGNEVRRTEIDNDSDGWTYEFKYFTEGRKQLDVHRDSGMTFRKKHVPVMIKAKESDVHEQTAIEAQSESGGFLEFETSKWFRKWSELKPRIQDMIKMTEAIDDQKTVTDVDTAAIQSKINADPKRKKLKGGTVMGRLVEWPSQYSLEHLTHFKKNQQRLLVEIWDPEWGAKIQASEGLALTEYRSLYKEQKGDSKPISKMTLEAGNVVLTKGLNLAKDMSDEMKISNGFKLDTDYDETKFDGLRNFLTLVSNYIIKGQTKTKTKKTQENIATKFNYAIMSRTGFYSIYHNLLSKQEQLIFRLIVKNNTITKNLMNPIDSYLSSKGNSTNYPPLRNSFALGNDKVLRYGHGAKINPAPTPTIKSWLNSIYKGTEIRNRTTDLLSPMQKGGIASAATGAKDVETSPNKKDTNLVKFEIRGSHVTLPSIYKNNELLKPEPGNKQFRDHWLNFTETIFNNALENRSRTNEKDDPMTWNVDETQKTALIKD